MYTKTLASNGSGDFTTINLWVSHIQSNKVSGGVLTDDVKLDVLSSGYTASASDTVTGWTSSSGTYQTILTSISSSWIDNASVRTTPHMYNASVGAFIDYSGDTTWKLTFEIENVTISRLQFKSNVGNYSTTIMYQGTSNDYGFRVHNCIFEAIGDGNREKSIINPSGSYPPAYHTFEVINCLFVITNCFGQLACISSSRVLGAYVAYCTFVFDNVGPYQPSKLGSSVNISGYATPGLFYMKNCVSVNFTKAWAGGNHGTDHDISNCATTEATFSDFADETDIEFNIDIDTEFVGGTSYNDFRLDSGAVQLKDTGIVISNTSLDSTGTSRGSTPDIGSWELASAPAAGFSYARAIFLN